MEITDGGVRMESGTKRMTTQTDPEAASQAPRQGEVDAKAEAIWLQSDMSDEQWERVENGLQESNMMVVFAMNEVAVDVGRCSWFLKHFTAVILEMCADIKVKFLHDELRSKKGGRMLIGRPSTRDRNLWMLLKRGYLMVEVGAATGPVRIFVRPDYTGKDKSNLSLNELEYTNGNKLQPNELVDMVRQWGETDVVVASHTRYNKVEQMWPPIWCMQDIADSYQLRYSYRLFFASAEEANRVYAHYLSATTPRVCRFGNPVDTVEFRMVSNVDWDGRNSRIYRVGTDDEASKRKVLVLGLRNEVSQEQLQQLLEHHGLMTTAITIPSSNGSYAEMEFSDLQTAESAMTRFGRDGRERLQVGSIPLYLKAKKISKGCHECGRLGHFIAECPELGRANPSNARHRYPLVDRNPAPRQRELGAVARTSESSMAVAERMVNSIIDVRLEGLHSALEGLTRQNQIAERHRQNLEQKITQMEESTQQIADLAARRAVAFFLESNQRGSNNSGEPNTESGDQHMRDVQQPAFRQDFH